MVLFRKWRRHGATYSSRGGKRTGADEGARVAVCPTSKRSEFMYWSVMARRQWRHSAAGGSRLSRGIRLVRQLSKLRDVITRAAHTRPQPAAHIVRPAGTLSRFCISFYSRSSTQCISTAKSTRQVRLGPPWPRPLWLARRGIDRIPFRPTVWMFINSRSHLLAPSCFSYGLPDGGRGRSLILNESPHQFHFTCKYVSICFPMPTSFGLRRYAEFCGRLLKNHAYLSIAGVRYIVELIKTYLYLGIVLR